MSPYFDPFIASTYEFFICDVKLKYLFEVKPVIYDGWIDMLQGVYLCMDLVMSNNYRANKLKLYVQTSTCIISWSLQASEIHLCP